MNVTHKFTTDLQTRGITERIHAMQSDANTRAVEVTLLSGGEAWQVPAGVAASVSFCNLADGHKGWYDTLPDGSEACTIENNVVTAILAPAVLSAAGEVRAAIVFQDADLNQLATFGFSILVEKNPAAGSAASNNYYAYSTMEEVNGALTLAGPAIVCEETGEAVAVSDASDKALQGLSIYGKTSKDGTPTPDAPIDLVSTGSGGSIGVSIVGKNLLKYPYANGSGTVSGHTRTVNNDGTVTFSGTPTAQINYYFSTGFKVLANVTYTMSVGGDFTITGAPFLYLYSSAKGVVSSINLATQTVRTFTPKEDLADISIYIVNVANAYVTGTIKPQIEVGASATAYEPYKEAQTLSLSTPNGLPGISVAKNGNYTDSNGTQWVCDEIDLARGVYVQRVSEYVYDGAYRAISTHANGQQYCSFQLSAAANSSLFGTCVKVLSDRYKGYHWTDTDNGVYLSGNALVITDSRFVDSATARDILNEEQAVFLYILKTPIETPLDADTLAAYAVLHSNKPNTTVTNDAGAGQKVAYVADTKLYIDNKFTELTNAIVAMGGTI